MNENTLFYEGRGVDIGSFYIQPSPTRERERERERDQRSKNTNCVSTVVGAGRVGLGCHAAYCRCMRCGRWQRVHVCKKRAAIMHVTA